MDLRRGPFLLNGDLEIVQNLGSRSCIPFGPQSPTQQLNCLPGIRRSKRCSKVFYKSERCWIGCWRKEIQGWYGSLGQVWIHLIRTRLHTHDSIDLDVKEIFGWTASCIIYLFKVHRFLLWQTLLIKNGNFEISNNWWSVC